MNNLANTSSISDLVARTHQAQDVNELLEIAQEIDRVDDAVFAEEGIVVKKLVVLTGYTSTFICDVVKAILIREKICLRILESEFGLFEQAIYGRDPAISDFGPDLVYFCVGRDHIGKGIVEAEASRWMNLWQASYEFLGVDIIANTFETPPNRAYGNLEAKGHGEIGYVRNLNDLITRTAPDFVHFNDIEWLSSYWGKATWRDERLYDKAKIPVSFMNIDHYAANLASVCAAVFGRTRKCLVIDLDNTLWGGVIGDDGLEGIRLAPDGGVGEAFWRFQKYLKSLADRGVILAVCSKNEYNIAVSPFKNHPDMVLKLDDIACFKANWENKNENIVEIAQTLNIGLDSIVFVDDNPSERAIVERFLPDVAVVAMPDDPADYVTVLSGYNYFDAVVITNEDQNRTRNYQSNEQRQQMQATAVSYEQFLSDMQMKATVAPIKSENLVRASQLINKTNQFNLTNTRYGQAEVAAMSEDTNMVTACIRLTDQFGDNGLISVFIGRTENLNLIIDTWIMSCRVLKRNVEYFLFRHVVQVALEQGIETIIGVYKPTPRNGLVKDLFSELGFEKTASNEAAECWSFDLGDIEKCARVLDRETFIEEGHLSDA